MRKTSAVLFGTFILNMMLAGCGVDTAPTAFLRDGPERTSVIYGEDSIANVLGSSDVNSNATVAFVYKDRWEKFSKYNLSLSVEEGYAGMEDFSWHDDPALSFCSGVLIASDKVLTAGHCFPDKEQCQKSVIVLYYQKDKDPKDMQAFPCEKVLASKNELHNDLDYALIQIKGKASQFPVTFFGLLDQYQSGDELYAVGHPLGSYKKTAQGKVRRVNDKTGLITATIDVFEGNSGSPVFSAKTKEFIGLLSSGENDFDLPNPETGEQPVLRCEEDSCSGEFIIPIQKILADIKKST